MTFVTHDSGELDAWQSRDFFRELQSWFAGRYASPRHADIDLENCPHTLSRGFHGPADRQRLINMVKNNNRIRDTAELDHPLDFAVANDVVGDEQIGNAGGGEHFGFAELGAGEADCAGFNESAADIG